MQQANHFKEQTSILEIIVDLVTKEIFFTVHFTKNDNVTLGRMFVYLNNVKRGENSKMLFARHDSERMLVSIDSPGVSSNLKMK